MARRILKVSLVTATLAVSACGTTIYLDSSKQIGITSPTDPKKITWSKAIQAVDKLCEQVKNESGTPGLVVSVSVDGLPVYQKGLGYADVENHIPCQSNTVMRIASISKSMTMAVVAKLWQEGGLSLDKPVQEYVSDFPEKFVDGEKAEITLRHLVSHLSGIRHYEKPPALSDISSTTIDRNPQNDTVSDTQRKNKNEFENQEYLLNSYFESVSKSLALFKDDDLFSKPGVKFLYTTHGWTLVSAVVESVVKKSFPSYMKVFFHEMGLRNTYLDENKPLIFNRAKYYVRNEKGRLENAPNVDNSYKWAGGGFLSTSDDLVKFGNAMLYSYQNSNGFLKRDTVQMIWSPVSSTSLAWDRDGQYGMGWGVISSHSNYPFCKSRQFYVSHTGGAIGASSVLLVLPRNDDTPSDKPIRGIVVSMIANLQSVGLNQTALEIAKIFESVAD